MANAIFGDRPEPFFSSCLASVETAIDFLVANDNSANPDNPNLKVLQESRLYREGKAAIIRTDLSRMSGFDEARNLCLQETGKRFDRKEVWVLYLDCDEVHADGLRELTREFLPRLPWRSAVVDGYFYQFLQSFDYYYSLDRRHNLLFRYHPGLYWEKPIHSELRGIRGGRVPTGYVYFHYGYLFAPENVLKRWRLYKKYDSVPLDLDPESMSQDDPFRDYEKWLYFVRFRGRHPQALSAYAREGHPEEHLRTFTARVEEHLARHPLHRWIGQARELNWRLRLAFRELQGRLASAF